MTEPDPPTDAPLWRTYPDPADNPGEMVPFAAAGPPDPYRSDRDPAWPTLPAPYTPPGYTRDDPLVIAAGWSTNNKEGVWTVPPYLRLEGDMGTIKLDFQRAQPTASVIDVDVVGGAGTIKLILPEGWAARLDRLSPGLGSRHCSVSEQPLGGLPVLVLRGRVGWGTLTIRYPKPKDLRRMSRQMERERRTLQ
jgi:hypothetical protein